MTAPYKDRVVTAARITKVGRAESFVTLTFADRPAMQFDDVVFATHGNQVLPLLENPTPAERDVLREFTTSRNEVCLHTDERLLPRRKAARAAWNYILQPPGARAASLTYHMNRLQSITTREQYCVTVNDDGRIHPEKSLRKFVYHHPQFTREAISAQGRWGEISGRQRIHYCGAYWIYGFHEDGLKSAMRVARALGVTC